ncbi:MAG: ExbD/TolR family protein [Phycisphaerales bacterium]
MSRAFRRGPIGVRANLTPMIDVTFLLIVFFVLVAQITNTQIAEEIDLPTPDNSVSRPPEVEQRLTLNILPDADASGGARAYRLGAREFPATTDGRAALARELNDIIAADPTARIDFRADRSTRYAELHPVLEAVIAAGVPRMNLVVIIEPSTRGPHGRGDDR